MRAREIEALAASADLPVAATRELVAIADAKRGRLCAVCRGTFFGVSCGCAPAPERFMLGGAILDGLIIGAIAELMVHGEDLFVTAEEILEKVRTRGAKVGRAAIEARLVALAKEGRVEVR